MACSRRALCHATCSKWRANPSGPGSQLNPEELGEAVVVADAPEYSRYSQDELRDALDHVDAGRFPDREEAIRREIETRVARASLPDSIAEKKRQIGIRLIALLLVPIGAVCLMFTPLEATTQIFTMLGAGLAATLWLGMSKCPFCERRAFVQGLWPAKKPLCAFCCVHCGERVV